MVVWGRLHCAGRLLKCTSLSQRRRGASSYKPPDIAHSLTSGCRSFPHLNTAPCALEIRKGGGGGATFTTSASGIMSAWLYGQPPSEMITDGFPLRSFSNCAFASIARSRELLDVSEPAREPARDVLIEEPYLCVKVSHVEDTGEFGFPPDEPAVDTLSSW